MKELACLFESCVESCVCVEDSTRMERWDRLARESLEILMGLLAKDSNFRS